jgi:hypothetical protein
MKLHVQLPSEMLDEQLKPTNNKLHVQFTEIYMEAKPEQKKKGHAQYMALGRWERAAGPTAMGASKAGGASGPILSCGCRRAGQIRRTSQIRTAPVNNSLIHFACYTNQSLQVNLPLP